MGHIVVISGGGFIGVNLIKVFLNFESADTLGVDNLTSVTREQVESVALFQDISRSDLNTKGPRSQHRA